ERILFVDDEPVLVEIGRQMLERLGYEVQACTGSLEALEMIRSGEKEFDLVITDQTMPKMTGAELAQRIAACRPELPVILCSGFSEAITDQGGQGRGIRAFLMKPMVYQELARTIREVLDE
ncbi:MAG: response regulator, partial [Thermodesulfobacteriota bacterium]